MLTSDAKAMLYTFYTEYLARRKVGISKRAAKNFRSAQSVHDSFFDHLPLDDVLETMNELSRNGYLYARYADNTIFTCELTDHAIATMEALPFEKFLTVTDFISKFVPLIPMP